MKKVCVSIFFVGFFFLPTFLGGAKEESPSVPLDLSSLKTQHEAVTRPFEFSIKRGEWAEGKAGPLFTTGVHPPDFVLPSLKEAPVPIRYPRWAVQEGWEGTFVIAVEILETGKVGRWKVLESTRHSPLDQAATRAVRRWQFYPAKEHGKPIVTCIQIPIRFELQE
jgi:TonB family protein